MSIAIAVDDKSPASEEEPVLFSDEELVSKAVEGMELIAKGAYQQATDVLIPTTKKKDFKTLFLQQVEVAHSTYLKPLGLAAGTVELVSDDIAGASYRRLTFVEKFGFGLCGYRLVFYKAGAGWHLVHFNIANGETYLTLNRDPKLNEHFAEPIAIATKIGDLFANEKVTEAMSELKDYAVAPVQRSVTPEMIERVSISQRWNAINGNPSLHEIEVLQIENLGKVLVRVHVVQRMKQNGNNMCFTFLKAEDEWRICTISFEQPVVPVFESNTATSDSK